MFLPIVIVLKVKLKYLRTLDKGKRIFIFFEYRRGLVVAQISQDNNKIRIINDACVANDNWSGIPSTVLVITINNIIKVIIGTNQGELIEYQYLNRQLIEVDRIQLSFAISCSQFLKQKNILLLSGKNLNNQACIYWISYSEKEKVARPLWKSEEFGSIRMMAISEDNTKDNTALWAINQEQGELLSFTLSPYLFSKDTQSRSRQLSEQCWIKTQQTLHAMTYSEDLNMVVCGGGEGVLIAFNSKTGALLWRINCSGNIRRIRYLPQYKNNQGVWMVCGDDRNLYMIDGQGKLQGLEEKYGPVSSLWVLNEQNEILLSSQSGRIIYGKVVSNNKTEIDCWTAPLDSLYPLRRGLTSNRRINELDLREPLVALAFIQHWLTRMQGKNHVDDNLDNEVETLLLQMKSFHQVAYFLQQCSEVVKTQEKQLPLSFYLEVFSIIKKVWEKVHRQAEPETVCKVLAPVIFLLKILIARQEELLEQGDESPASVLEKIQGCIWLDKQHKKNHCALCQCDDALISLRLIQALDIWRDIDLKNQIDPNAKIIRWCKEMLRLWHSDNVEEIRSNFARLFEDGLNLTGAKETAKYENWLRALVKPDYPKAHEVSALKSLEIPSFTELSLFEDPFYLQLFNDSKIWEIWLRNLYTQLKHAKNAHHAMPHNAREELLALKALKNEIGRAANEFSNNNEPFLQLWLPCFQHRWLPFLKQALDNVYQIAKDKPCSYLLINCQVLWVDGENTRVIISLINNHPNTVELLSIQWNGAEHNLIQQSINLTLNSPEQQLEIAIETSSPEHLKGNLLFNCNCPDRNYSFEQSLSIDEERSLENFSYEPEWQPSWKYLTVLLNNIEQTGNHFVWLTGNYWSEQEHLGLSDNIQKKYHIDIQDDHYSLQDKSIFETDNVLFSPDLALGAGSFVLLQQLHDLLHSQNNAIINCLSLWCAFQSVPKSILTVLKHKLTDKPLCVSLLQKLMPGRENEVIACLASLPTQALGAWCAGETIFSSKQSQQESLDWEQLYLPSASLLPYDYLLEFDTHKIKINDMALFFSITEDQAEQQREARTLLLSSWDYCQQSVTKPGSDVDKLVPFLLSILCNNSIQVMTPLGWSSKSTDIQLLHQDFDNCYLLPKTGSDQRRQLLKQELEPGLWLCLGETETPTELKGLVLNLDQQSCFSLLHIKDKSQALRILNSIAVRQFPKAIKDYCPFRTAGGMGHTVAKHFYGRDSVLCRLKKLMQAVDANTGNASALFIGGRRMGKTSLRERILYEIKRDEPKRVCIFLDCQTFNSNDYLGLGLEFEFHRLLRNLIKQQGFHSIYAWSKQYRDSIDARDQSREELKNLLKKIHTRSGYAPLLIFDETDILAKADADNPGRFFEVFTFIRELIYQRYICCFATSYPHGASNKEALNVATKDSGSPLNNTFIESIILGAWPGDIAWSFLENKLAGLGLVLPLQYRGELLAMSRGIPWVVQAFGWQICHHLPKNSTVISHDVWQYCKCQVLAYIEEEMLISVNNITERIDEEYGLLQVTRQQQRLSQGNLWQALIKLVPELSVCEFGQDRFFTVQELKQQLPNVQEKHLREALNRLSSSMLIKGDNTNRDRFYFANNLLPAYCYFKELL